MMSLAARALTVALLASSAGAYVAAQEQEQEHPTTGPRDTPSTSPADNPSTVPTGGGATNPSTRPTTRIYTPAPVDPK